MRRSPLPEAYPPLPEKPKHEALNALRKREGREAPRGKRCIHLVLRSCHSRTAVEKNSSAGKAEHLPGYKAESTLPLTLKTILVRLTAEGTFPARALSSSGPSSDRSVPPRR